MRGTESTDENDFLFARIFRDDDRNVLWLRRSVGSAAGLGLPGCLRSIHGPGPIPHGSGTAAGTNEAGTRRHRSANSLGHAPVHAWLLGGGRVGHSLARFRDHSTGLATIRSGGIGRFTGPGYVGLDTESIFLAGGPDSNGTRAPLDHQ